MMTKCYDCMEEGKETDAVAVCIVCGKALCMDHSKELILPVSVGKPPNVKHLHNGLPRNMCNYCLGNVVDEGFCV
ncbi:DUF2180 family protein [Methanococcoides orientis]|uniref:DUF2180 family protein n=1 Tax=Methanococcoides orientis TaxID=2822137 RepID=UPI002873C05B|nr:DUF2180 family protein [Methanococcoides orientis]